MVCDLNCHINHGYIPRSLLRNATQLRIRGWCFESLDLDKAFESIGANVAEWWTPMFNCRVDAMHRSTASLAAGVLCEVQNEYGVASLRSCAQHLPPGQLRPWPVRCRQQMGQGTLCRVRQAHRLCPRHGIMQAQGDQELGLPPSTNREGLSSALAVRRQKVQGKVA